MLSGMESGETGAVLVVGAGPTGLVLANELALAGVGVTVVERQAVPSGQSRGGGVNPRTAEVLAMRGLLDAVAARAVPREGGGAHFAGLPVRLDARPWRTRHPGGLLVPQDRMEEVLDARVREQGVTVRRSTALTGLVQDEDGVTAVVAGPDGEHRMRCAYLVACDGGHSTVRKLVGAAFPGRSGTMSAVSADVDLASASATVPRTAGHMSTLQRTGGGYWMLLHPLDGDAGADSGYRVVFGAPGRPAPPREAPVTAEEVGAALAAVHGPGTVLRRLRWGTRFSDASRQLAAYRHGRVLFAGDAAHIHLPIGGQGLNLGVQDAINLGWKLGAAVRGAPDALLDSYHAERHPVAARVLALVRAQGVIMNPPEEADDVRALRDVVIDLARTPDGNRHLAGLMTGLAVRYDLDGSPDPLVGSRMVDLSLRTADGPTTVSTLLRSGRGLLLDVTGALRPAATRGGVDHVTARVVDSVVGTALEADRVLVRPDGHVCWAGPAGSSPDSALRRWFGAVPAVA
jgi:2-polyprenyl-6-methoxyphenol hydroxylase-like FAD-dependent oxidoreductase